MGLLEATLGGLQYAGDVADKFGGRAIRGGLGGKPRELLSPIPFSDTLGITDPSQRVSGRDLTNKWGVTRKEDQGWGASLAGMGTEMALDPLNFLGAGLIGHAAAPAIRESGMLGKAGEAAGDFGRASREFLGSEHGSLGFRSPRLKDLDQAARDFVEQIQGREEHWGLPGSRSAHAYIAPTLEAAQGWEESRIADLAETLRKGSDAAFAWPYMHGTEMNLALRDPKQLLRHYQKYPATTLPPEEATGIAGDLSRLIGVSRTPEDVRLLRGISQPGVRKIAGMLGGGADLRGAEGLTFADPGFMSTTFHPGIAEEAAGLRHSADFGRHKQPGVVLDLGDVPAGRSASYLHPTQGEVLFPPGQNIRIDDTSKYPYVKATLLDAIKNFAKGESGAVGFRAPYTPEDVAKLTGVHATQISHPEASSSFASWIASLSPEERTAIEMYTRGPQQRISHALRGEGSTSPGNPYNPFDEPSYGSVPGAPRIETPADVHSEVVPYLDAALSRATTPRDLMTYRGARQFADMTPENAQAFLGRTLRDPSYLSTTVDPWGRFYGNSAFPSDLLLDIAMPKGTQGGYAGAVSRWDKEKELILPRGMPLQVANIQKAPVKKIDYTWYRLDPEGKPIPHQHTSGGQMFASGADERMEDLLSQGVLSGDFVVPHSWMNPHWERLAAEGLQGEGEQTSVLLKALGVDLPPHTPAVQRRSSDEIINAIHARALASPSKNDRFLKNALIRMRKLGKAPDAEFLRNIEKQYKVLVMDLLHSFPRGESGSLASVVAGVAGRQPPWSLPQLAGGLLGIGGAGLAAEPYIQKFLDRQNRRQP